MRATAASVRCVVLALLLAPTVGGAQDWPCARHDPQRTGAAGGPLRLPAPAVRWRHYLGGQLQDNQWRVTDIDGDGVTDVVFVASGKVICKHADDSLVWESDLVDATYLVGVDDLDHDGHGEVVVVGNRGALLVLNGTTGRVLWEVPTAARGFGSTARLGDLDGDGVDELYVGECVHTPAGALAYSFRDGYAAPRQLWQQLGSDQRCGDVNDLIVDLDGDGMNEVVMAEGDTTMQVLDGRSGVVRWTVPAPPSGTFTQKSVPVAVNVDDDPARELVVVTNFVHPGDHAYGARRVAVFDPPTPTHSTATLLWEYVDADRDNGNLAFTADSVGDLDGDGHPEVAFSVYDGAAHRWDLTVRDAATGVVRASRSGYELVGILPAAATNTGHPLLLGMQDDQGMAGLTYGAGALTTRWTVPSRRPASSLDPALAGRVGFVSRPIALQLDADPELELLATVFDPTVPVEARTITTLVAYDLSAADPVVLGSLDAPMATTMLTFRTGDNLSRQITQPLVVTSDGYLLALDEMLRPTNRLVGAEFTIPGMRVGGYYSGIGLFGPTPVIGPLPGAAGAERSVLIRDSRPALVRLDVRTASLVSPPAVRWARARAAWPVIADLDGDNANDLAALDGRALISIEPVAGTTRWSVDEAAGPVGSTTSGDLLPLRRAGEAGVDLVFQRVDPGTVVRPSAFRGRDGTLRWNTFSRSVSSGIGGFAVADFSGDGTDDVVTTLNALNLIDGRDGTGSANGYGVPYGTPVVSSWSGAPEFYLQASTYDGLYRPDLTAPHGQLSDVPLSASLGAVLRCGDQPAFALSPQGGAELRVIRPQSLPATGPAPAAATLARVVLAGGLAYPTAADVPATVRVGTLSNATAVADGDADGHPTLLVGGTDGWLYSLDGCSLALRWAHDFHYPVGEPIVGDADGDGTDDLLVTVGDGYLYAMGPRTLPTPTNVLDTDPADDTSDVDLDEVETFDTVTARWDATPGATRYQVRVTTQAGTSLQFPEYGEVTDPRARVTGLPLRVGGRYRVGVVAVSASGESDEAQSDGFVVVDRSPPTITINANPGTFTTPASTNLEVLFSDRTGLATTHAEILDPSGATVRVLVDETLRTPLPSRAVRFAFDGVGPDGHTYLAPGVYTIRASATDVAAHTAAAMGTFTMVVTSPTVVTPVAPAADPGCGCMAGPVERAPRTAWALAALGLAVTAARRRSRRR